MGCGPSVIILLSNFLKAGSDSDVRKKKPLIIFIVGGPGYFC